MKKIFKNQIFIPMAALLVMIVFNFVADPSFFKITLGYNSAGNPVLSGYLMTILDYGSELAILAIGMTLVTAASGGQDISVGAAIAIAGSVILGLCVAVTGLIKVSRLSSINYSVIVKDIEMDAILAVAFGGNALSGGKFNMTASILGAYVIQFLTTTLYKFNVQADALPAYKAVVVIVLVVLSAPAVKDKISSLSKKLGKKQAKEVA